MKLTTNLDKIGTIGLFIAAQHRVHKKERRENFPPFSI